MACIAVLYRGTCYVDLCLLCQNLPITLYRHWQAFTSIGGSDTPSDTTSAVAGVNEDSPSRLHLNFSETIISLLVLSGFYRV